MTMILNAVLIAVGLGLLVVGAGWLVDGATEVAHLLHVSELLIGLTIVAVATSLPEIATSLVATLRGHRDIAVGNVVGSNIFNLLTVLGVAVAFSPQPVIVPADALQYDIPIMFAATVCCWPNFYTASAISGGKAGVLGGIWGQCGLPLFEGDTASPARTIHHHHALWRPALVGDVYSSRQWSDTGAAARDVRHFRRSGTWREYCDLLLQRNS